MNVKKRLVLILALICAALLCAYPALAQSEPSALFINVGKADAALLWLDGERWLVDTGHKDSHDQLARVLDAYGVSHLDGVVITHTDKDHAGGLKKLLKNGYTIGRLYAGALHSEKSAEDHPAYEAAEKYGVPLTWLSAGDEIALGSCTLRVLGPLRVDSAKENNNSLVLRLATPEGDMLLTGDMELPEEADLLAAGLIQPAAVLKVAHHGEDDATSKQFLLAARPQWAVISTSTRQEPDTPDPKILSRLWEIGSTTAVTQDAEVGILITLSAGRAEAQRIDWQ